MRHPTAFDLDRWARSFADPGLRALAQHVLACVECRQRALRALATAPGRGRGISPVEPGELDEALIDSFERVRDRALACVGGERLRVDALYAELVSHPPARRELLVANSSRYGSALLARRVLEASRDSCHGDAAASESLARLALAILERADVAVYGARLLADLAGRAWSFLGNARRAANDLAGAETAFGRAGAELAATGDPLERAGYYRRLASLRRDQCRFAEARELLAGAADLYAEIGDEERRGRTLCGLGLALLEEERAGAAIEPLVEALTMVDPLADPRSAMSIHHNLGLCFCELGLYEEAQRHHREAGPFYARFDDRPTAARARWLAGLLAAGFGRTAEAEEILFGVMREFVALARPFEAAHAGLDLAGILARRGPDARFPDLARELHPLLFTHRFDRDSATALTAFLRAAETGGLDRELVTRARRALRRARPGGTAAVGGEEVARSGGAAQLSEAPVSED